MQSLNSKAIEIMIKCENEHKDSCAELALLLIEHAIEIDPDNRNTYTTKISVYSDLRDYFNIINTVDNYLQFNPDDVDFNYQKALALHCLGKTEESRSQLMRTLNCYVTKLSKEVNEFELMNAGVIMRLLGRDYELANFIEKYIDDSNKVDALLININKYPIYDVYNCD